MRYFFILFSVFSVLVSLSVFLTFKAQMSLTYPDIAENKITTLQEFDNQFSFFPNITSAAIPIDALRASFAFTENKIGLANDLLTQSIIVNPYIGYSEYVKAQAFYALGNIDSSLFYAKQSFVKWPKSLSNYKMYLKTLAFKGDTTGIQSAYNSISAVFKDRKPYSKEFINYYSKAKLKYLITDYSDKKNVLKESLYGSWIKSYEFLGGRVKHDSTKVISFNKSYMIATNGTKFRYYIQNDSLLLHSFLNNQFLTKNSIYFSKEFNTLIITSSSKENTIDQFFKKIE